MNRIIFRILILSIFILIIVLSTWIFVLLQTNADHFLSKNFPWPIACSTRGCISSIEWAQQRTYDIAFAKETGKTIPTQIETLTTILRRHLISYADPQSPVQLQDAIKYRTAILHTTDIAAIAPLGMSSFAQYDSLIILPFLQQEALMQQQHITTTDNLYANLTQQRFIILLLFRYHWDNQKGKISN